MRTSNPFPLTYLLDPAVGRDVHALQTAEQVIAEYGPSPALLAYLDRMGLERATGVSSLETLNTVGTEDFLSTFSHLSKAAVGALKGGNVNIDKAISDTRRAMEELRKHADFQKDGNDDYRDVALAGLAHLTDEEVKNLAHVRVPNDVENWIIHLHGNLHILEKAGQVDTLIRDLVDTLPKEEISFYNWHKALMVKLDHELHNTWGITVESLGSVRSHEYHEHPYGSAAQQSDNRRQPQTLEAAGIRSKADLEKLIHQALRPIPTERAIADLEHGVLGYLQHLESFNTDSDKKHHSTEGMRIATTTMALGMAIIREAVSATVHVVISGTYLASAISSGGSRGEWESL